MYQRYWKRAIDIVLSLSALILLSPVFLIVALWIKLDSTGPILFTQKRVGQGKSHFTLLKFRTMHTTTPSEVATHLLKNPDAYITKCGRFLRRSSLDELPQLLNILLGHMSVVGPRPALWNQFDLIAERDLYSANDVRPGLTGWAQVNGRDELDIKTKARLDGEYVKTVSFAMDVKCLLMTVGAVVTEKGVVEGQPNEAANEQETTL